MDITEWYLPDDNTIRKELHWEIFKPTRANSLAFLGQEKTERFKNIGKIGRMHQELYAKFEKAENPYWDIYGSVEAVKLTNSVSREQFKKDVKETEKSLHELAYKYKTFPKVVEKNIQKLENRQLPNTVTFPANLGGKDIKESHVNDNNIQDTFWNYYLYKEQTPCFSIPFDIDGPKHEDINKTIDKAHEEAKKVYKYLRKHNCPVKVKFSGGKGFHIEIPRQHLQRYVDSTNYAHYAGNFAQFIAEETGANFDQSIYDTKRIFRAPYSMHTETNLIAVPLTEDQFLDFKLKYASPDYIRSNMNLRQRNEPIITGKANKIIKKFRKSQHGKNL